MLKFKTDQFEILADGKRVHCIVCHHSYIPALSARYQHRRTKVHLNFLTGAYQKEYLKGEWAGLWCDYCSKHSVPKYEVK